MAFDGVTMAAVAKQLLDTIKDGRISKIAQPEDSEILLTVHTQQEGNVRLLISADASLPLIYLTDTNKQAPLSAPAFCMLLRKHIQGGRITDVFQPGLERIIRIEIEHLDEMGDLRHKYLVLELMGKHSNIIFLNDDETIIDSIKRISSAVSSVREVLPGRKYFIPPTQEKKNLTEVSADEIMTSLSSSQPLFKTIYGSFTGISPILAQELCYRAEVDSDMPAGSLELQDKNKITHEIIKLADQIRGGKFEPCIAYEGKKTKEFAAVRLTMFEHEGCNVSVEDSVSAMLEQFYREKNTQVYIRQKSADLRHVVQLAIERNSKKLDLQLKQLKDTENRDKYRLYGELLTAYNYQITPGAKKADVDNYYTGEKITIPMDANLTASENAQKFFDKYSKLKRTYEALTVLIKDVQAELEHLQSVQISLDIASTADDLSQIREELVQGGYIKKKNTGKKEKIVSRPLHYLSSDGYDIYVGKNNFQNDELTFKFANGGDWWFHAKKIHGSHVILKNKQGQEIPDRAYEEAAKLAAYYSQGRDQEKTEVDYVRKKEVKKPNGAKPGFVVYYTNYSMTVGSDISGLTLLK